MNEFSVIMLFLGLPGIICLYFKTKLNGKSNSNTIELIFEVFLYSVSSYLMLELIICLFNLLPCFDYKFSPINKLMGIIQGNKLEPKLLIFSSLSSIIFAYFLSYVLHYNLINLIGQKIKATKRYGDDDVWHYFHNAPDSQKNDGWVIVRDFKCQLAYYCYISTWSDSGSDRELVLSEVSIYDNNTAEYLYSLEHLYICRNNDELTIEIPPANAKMLEDWKQEEQKE